MYVKKYVKNPSNLKKGQIGVKMDLIAATDEVSPERPQKVSTSPQS